MKIVGGCSWLLVCAAAVCACACHVTCVPLPCASRVCVPRRVPVNLCACVPELCFQLMCPQSMYTLVASTPRLCVPRPYNSAHIPGLCVPGPTYQHQHVFCRRLSLSVSKQKWLICPLMAHIVEKLPHSPLVGQAAKSGIALETQTVQQQRLLERSL